MNNDKEAAESFLSRYFRDEVRQLDKKLLTQDERDIIRQVLGYVRQRFAGMKYILGTALDFTLLAQRVAQYDARFHKTQNGLELVDIFNSFSIVEIVGSRTANTLTFKMPDGQKYGIRKIEEEVVDFFHGVKRSAYPSAYVYNTGQWRKFEDLLLLCFKLGEFARYTLSKALLEYGLAELTANTFWTRNKKRPRLFSQIIQPDGYERSFSGQNGGLILQAIYYGFFKSDRPHLDFIVDKVRTGSSRQHRFGDIDTYAGVDLELSAEVKDLAITTDNLDRQCGSFLRSCEEYGIKGIICCEDITYDAHQMISSSGCAVLSLPMVRDLVELWDWPKQDSAYCSCLHYISHVEQDADATRRILQFTAALDPNHSMQEFVSLGSQS